MANTIHLTPNCKVFQVVGLVCFMMLVQKSSAVQFIVGGAKGWTVPDDTNVSSYNQWAEMTRFRIGDSLLFKYNPDQDSVLEVTKEDYDSCTTTQPIEKYSGGHTIFTFSNSGPHHFISGNKENCDKNEKLVVVVLADRSNRSSNTNQTTAASPPSPESSSGTVPSPAPTGDEPSPPTGTVEINPTPAPSDETPHSPPSSASSLFVSFIGSTGAFFVSSLIF